MSTLTDTVTRTSFDTPDMWAVVFHNDDFTPFDFVIMVLMQYFNQDERAANEIAQKVHDQGRAKIGRFTKEIALTKVRQVTTAATRADHPLKVTAEVL